MDTSQWQRALAGPEDAGRRIDRIVRVLRPDLTLGTLYRAFRQGLIRVEGKKVCPDYRISSGQGIDFSPALGSRTQKEAAPEPQAEALSAGLFILRTPDLVLLNKEPGSLVHDGEQSLEAAVRRAFPQSGRDSLAFSPGPLHRLDRNTSGIIAFSLSLRGAQLFTRALREQRVRKLYLAVLEGSVSDKEVWFDTLVRDRAARITRITDTAGKVKGGQSASMRIAALARSEHGNLSLAAIELATGRTHQIRAQAAAHGHPLAGDSKYGSQSGMRSNGPRSKAAYRLHAAALRFDRETALLLGLPEYIAAPLPDSFAQEARQRFNLDPDALPTLDSLF